MLGVPLGDLAAPPCPSARARARARGRSTSRARRRAPCRPGARSRAPRRSSACRARTAGRSTSRRPRCGARAPISRAAMSTSGWLEPWPLTIRMRSKPWWQSERPWSTQRLDEHVPAQRDAAGEVEVVRRVAVDLGREQQRLAAAGLDRALGDGAHEPRVGVDRQVVAVVLERRGGDRRRRGRRAWRARAAPARCAPRSAASCRSPAPPPCRRPCA